MRDKSRLKPAGSSNALTATTGAHTPPREILRVVSESALIARIVLEEFNRYAARASPTVPRGPTDPPRIPIAPHERRHAACARPCAALVISTTFPDRYPRQSTTLTLPLTDQAPTPQVQALAALSHEGGGPPQEDQQRCVLDVSPRSPPISYKLSVVSALEAKSGLLTF